MSVFSHCQRCGRKLRDSLYCPGCGQWLCSFACLDEHVAEHRAPTATPDDPSKPAIVIDPLPEGRGIGVEGRSDDRANRPVRLERVKGPGTSLETAAPARRRGRSA